MYHIRRVWKVNSGQARNAAKLVKEIATDYSNAGQRSESIIYFNGGTLPGPREDLNRVYMQWTAEVIDSPYREGNKIPSSSAYSKLQELLDNSDGPSSWVEFWEGI